MATSKKFSALVILFLLFNFIDGNAFAFQQSISNFDLQYHEFKGEVSDANTGDPISSAHLIVEGSNISTITNSKGQFSLKIPADLLNSTIQISYLGYKTKRLAINSLKAENTQISLEETIQELTEVSVFKGGDPLVLVRNMLDKRGDNYYEEQLLMTAFYRETIKKRRKNISLSEAVVKIYKQPINSNKKDLVGLVKARKSTDYEKLDTLAVKLRGGPFNTLYVDLMKYPEYVFQDKFLDAFNFSFNSPTKINNRYIYVVDFYEKEQSTPWYYGKLFIDAETSSLVKASYKLNVEDKDTASQMFVKNKPSGVRVYPVDVSYEVDYNQKDGKWHFSYGTALLEFVVNWKNKLFNSRYTLDSEMVVTNWEVLNKEVNARNLDLIKPSIIMVDDVTGFSDPKFWGNNNIIEPDKSIQNAIEKIQRQINSDIN